MGRGAGERDDSKKRDSTMAKEHGCLILTAAQLPTILVVTMV